MSDQAQPLEHPFDARDSERPSSLPPPDGSRRRRRRRRTSNKKRRYMAKEIAFWVFALITVLLVTYVGLKLNDGSPP